MSMYPVWIHDKSTPKPDTPTLYEISANGIFIHKETPFWKAIVPVDRISILEEQKPQFDLLLPPIPKDIWVAVARFFAWVTEKQSTEAIVLLWWGGLGESSYRITVPLQSVSFGAIYNYDITQIENYHLIGTLHSHGSMPAFHSSTDRDDEANFDGIHGTFGGFSSPSDSFSLSIQACINGTRFTLDPIALFEGIAKSSLGQYVSESAPPNLYSRQQEQDRDWNEQHSGSFSHLYTGHYFRNRSEKYVLANEEKLLPHGYEPPIEWQENVKFGGSLRRSLFGLTASPTTIRSESVIETGEGEK